MTLASLASLATEAGRVRGVCFDLDDTFLTEGALDPRAYDALVRLADAKLRVVVVTGRPYGWGEVLLPLWPVDAVIVENGAISITQEGRRLDVDDPVPPETRAVRAEQLRKLVEDVERELPTIRPATDAWQRRSDTNWDIGETCVVPEPEIARLAELVTGAGAGVTRSSVHLHASYDATDKARGLVRLFERRYGVMPESLFRDYVFVGDSPNDESCFRAFRLSVGVANVHRHLSRLTARPRFVTTRACGEGFAELVECLLPP